MVGSPRSLLAAATAGAVTVLAAGWWLAGMSCMSPGGHRSDAVTPDAEDADVIAGETTPDTFDDRREDPDLPPDGDIYDDDTPPPDADLPPDGPVGEDAAPDGTRDWPEAWDVTPFVPETYDCPLTTNECYAALDDGGVACELPETIPYEERCEVSFKVWATCEISTDCVTHGDSFPGYAFSRDGTELYVRGDWRDRLANPGYCVGHCSSTILNPNYVVHIPTGTVLTAAIRGDFPMPEAGSVPSCEYEGLTPEGEPMGRCWRDYPEFDVRYTWRIERLQLPFTYEGAVVPAALRRQRLSTGEELAPVDLPIL